MSIPRKLWVLCGFHVFALVACSNKRETAVKETLLFESAGEGLSKYLTEEVHALPN